LPRVKDLDMSLASLRGLLLVSCGYSYDWSDVAHILKLQLPREGQIVTGALIAVAVSWAVARHALAPMKQAAHRLAEIDADALDHRIPLSKPPSEVVPFASA
jgi:hypothetical protein